MKQTLLNFFVGLVAIVVCNGVYSQTTYTWNIAGGGSWATATNWTPSRTAPAANDILRFTNGGTKTITNVPTQTIGKLVVTGNTNVSLEAYTTGNATLTVSTAVNDAIDVDAGSTLQIKGIRSGGNTNSLTLTTSNSSGLVVNIDGTLIVTYGNPSWTASLGTFTKGGTNAAINFNSGSTYTHDIDGNSIPTANWNSTSTCNITGLTNTAPSGLGQNFGNFIYDCPDHALLINFNSTLTSIAGDFTVKFAGEEQGVRTLNGLALSSNTNFTLNIGGDLIIDHPSSEATWLIMTTGTANITMNIGGDFLISNTGSGSCYFDYKYGAGTAMGTLAINLAGNLTMTGGYMDMAYQASGYSVGTELRVSGNVSVSATSTIISSGANLLNGKIIFNKSGTQTIYEASAGRIAYTNFQINSGSTLELLSHIYLYDYSTIKGGQFTVLSGGILDAGTFQIPSSTGTLVATYNSFTLNSGAGIVTANVNGVHQIGYAGPTISAAIGTRTFSSGANYTYDGTALQNSGTFITTPIANQVNNLTINNTTGANTTGVKLQQEFKVASVCTFIAGVFTTTNTNILTINDNATVIGVDLDAGSTKYVNGPMKKVGNDLFAFPVGKISHGCRPIYISAPSNTTDEFRAELIRGDAGILGPITAVGLERVSGCEYWYLDRLVGSSTVNVSLSWSGESPCNAQSYVTDLPNLVVAHFNGTSWDAYGNDGGITGNAVKGTVTWNNVSTFSPFSLGSILWWTNPLTVKFINLTASERNGQVKLDWGNIAETNVEKYIIEHSTDGRNFTAISHTTARLNNGNRTDYLWWHTMPATGLNFYRIKGIEYSGEITYSTVARITIGKTINEFTVYPNPVKGGQVNISASSLAAGRYDISMFNMSGQKIMQRSWDHSGGSISLPVDLPSGIKAGLYSIKLSSGDQKFVKTFLVE
jgi:hypothetical protein